MKVCPRDTFLAANRVAESGLGGPPFLSLSRHISATICIIFSTFSLAPKPTKKTKHKARIGSPTFRPPDTYNISEFTGQQQQVPNERYLSHIGSHTHTRGRKWTPRASSFNFRNGTARARLLCGAILHDVLSSTSMGIRGRRRRDSGTNSAVNSREKWRVAHWDRLFPAQRLFYMCMCVLSLYISPEVGVDEFSRAPRGAEYCAVVRCRRCWTGKLFSGDRCPCGCYLRGALLLPFSGFNRLLLPIVPKTFFESVGMTLGH